MLDIPVHMDLTVCSPFGCSFSQVYFRDITEFLFHFVNVATPLQSFVFFVISCLWVFLFISFWLSMRRSPLNTKRRSRKKRRKTRRRRRRRRSIITSITTVTQVLRSRCRTAPWRRKSPCQSVLTLWLAAYAPAHVSYMAHPMTMLALTRAHLSFSPCQITDCSLKTRTSRW